MFGNDRITVLAFFFPRGEFLLEGREQRESEGEHRAASLMGGGDRES